MKVKDVFATPLRFELLERGIYSGKKKVFSPGYSDNSGWVREAKLVIDVVNSHDELVSLLSEKDKELEDLRRVVRGAVCGSEGLSELLCLSHKLIQEERKVTKG
jgi:hypothetical protein